MNTVSQNNPSAPSSSPSLFYASNTNVFTFVWGFDNLPDDFYNKWVDHFLYITTVNDGLVVDVHYWYMPGQKPMHGNSPENSAPYVADTIEIDRLSVSVEYADKEAMREHITLFPHDNSSPFIGANSKSNIAFINALYQQFYLWAGKNEALIEKFVKQELTYQKEAELNELAYPQDTLLSLSNSCTERYRQMTRAIFGHGPNSKKNQ